MSKCVKTDCFAYRGGMCGCLSSVMSPCSFYKTRAQVEAENRRNRLRLMEVDWDDPIHRHIRRMTIKWKEANDAGNQMD